MDRDRYSYGEQRMADDPPNSRLFIVSNKKLNESDFREAFSKFGEIEDIWVVKDRRSGENKGVTYIKYSKTSEAAHAMEMMNGKTIAGSDRHIKVLIASDRNKGSQREENEDEKIHRLFVLIPKHMTEADVENYFSQFGDIDYVKILRDKETHGSKGFAYVKYYKFSHAARAYEDCDRKYKAVFSEPRKSNASTRRNQDYSMDRNSANSLLSTPSFNDSSAFGDDKCYRVNVIGSPNLTEDQLWKLFNIVPGMEYCQLRYEPNKRRTVGMVVYSSMQWANYATEKLHGFEYPTGSRLIVKPDGMVARMDGSMPAGRSISHDLPDSQNLRHLAETIAQATSVIQNAGLSSSLLPNPMSSAMLSPSKADVSDVCSVALPKAKPLASIDAPMEARCFIVCTPPPPSPSILRDIFCRFGNLIEVYMLAHRNCGYAKYASKESAAEAIRVLHGADICGGRMKVIEAEERGDHSRKRLRLDEQP